VGSAALGARHVRPDCGCDVDRLAVVVAGVLAQAREGAAFVDRVSLHAIDALVRDQDP
jgi:hypothetical protein